MKLSIHFVHDTVAVIREHRWWCADRLCTAALYGESLGPARSLWVRDHDNRPVSERVALEIERERLRLERERHRKR